MSDDIDHSTAVYGCKLNILPIMYMLNIIGSSTFFSALLYIWFPRSNTFFYLFYLFNYLNWTKAIGSLIFSGLLLDIFLYSSCTRPYSEECSVNTKDHLTCGVQ